MSGWGGGGERQGRGGWEGDEEREGRGQEGEEGAGGGRL